MVSKRADRHPGVFERVTVTLSPGNPAGGLIADLNGYVHSCSAVEKRPDAEFINMIIRFSGLDESQRQQLSEFIINNP